MLKSFKSGHSSKNKKITIGDISKPTSNIPETQLKNLNTIPIQKAQTLQQRQSDQNIESFGHRDYSRISSTTSTTDVNSGNFSSTNMSGLRKSSETGSVKKSFVNRVTSGVSMQSSHSTTSSNNGRGSHLYGIALYDFQAERNDELDCKAGENLIIFAHHDCEWFIAKTIDRIGGPGLVPCSFVMVIDLETGFSSNNSLEKDIELSGLPTVVEWKSSLQQQKSKNIDLKNDNKVNSFNKSAPKNTSSFVSSNDVRSSSGFLREPVQRINSSIKSDAHSSTASKPQQQQPNSVYKGSVNNSSYSVNSSSNKSNIREKNNSSRTSNINVSNNSGSFDEQEVDFILESKVTEYIWEDQKYKFIVKCLTSFSKDRVLKRSYEDFYNLQIDILESFPQESGKVIMPDGNMSQRIVPYIPGPVPYVTEDITKKRLIDLNTYVNELINLPNNISRSSKVLRLFEIDNNGFDKEQEHKNHLRSISQNDFPEASQELPQGQKEMNVSKNDNKQFQNSEQISADKFNSNIFQSLDNSPAANNITESNHGTIGANDENTLKLQGLKISEIQEELSNTNNNNNNNQNTIGTMGVQSINNINTAPAQDTFKNSSDNQTVGVSPSKIPSKLTINTQVGDGMDKSQSNNTITDLVNTPMTATPGAGKSIKIKFYYDDDIFALLLNSNITLTELNTKILKKIGISSYKLFNKVGTALRNEIKSDGDLQQAIALKQKIAIVE
ncbi:hypothetical protein ACO0SA_004275 [Hanseniaspora valbyensis]